MVKIAPSLLSCDFLCIGEAIKFINESADIIHIDVMDGSFVPNITIGLPVVQAISTVAVKTMDTHLMIVNPQNYVERFAAVMPKGSMLSFHLEACPDASVVLDKIRSLGMKAGLVINPDCPVEKLFPHLEHMDYALIMSVFAGFGGQKFKEETFERVKTLKAEIQRRGLSVEIEIDGGVGESNASLLAGCGADILVAGTSVFKAADPAEAVRRLKK